MSNNSSCLDSLDNLWKGEVSDDVRDAMEFIDRRLIGQETDVCGCGCIRVFTIDGFECPNCDKA